MLPIDPTADRSRRAWLQCPGCDRSAGCADCAEQRNCADHWQYLLSNEATVVNLQCPGCGHLWSTDMNHPRKRGRAA